jgi:hypothetical protein
LVALINRIRARLTVQRSVTMIELSAVKEDGPLFASAPAVEKENGRVGSRRTKI